MVFPLFLNGQPFNIEDEEKIVYYRQFGDYHIFQNTKKNTLFITDKNEETIIKNLKYWYQLSANDAQAIDKKNEIIYFDRELNILDFPQPINIGVCGSVDDFVLTLIKVNNQYHVETVRNSYFTEGGSTTHITATIEDEGFDNIYFINGEQTLRYDTNFSLPDYLIFEKNNKFGVIDKDNTFHYDAVHVSQTMFRTVLKVEKSGFFNYYHLSPNVKYKRLDDFEFYLAYFELENGKKGYVDLNGNEYYKN